MRQCVFHRERQLWNVVARNQESRQVEEINKHFVAIAEILNKIVRLKLLFFKLKITSKLIADIDNRMNRQCQVVDFQSFVVPLSHDYLHICKNFIIIFK